MKSIFDFDIIRKLIKGSDNKAPFNILIDSMNGGNYRCLNVKNILITISKIKFEILSN